MASKKYIVEVKGIKTYSYHGCLDEERREGGNYEVDVKMETDFLKATENDDLSLTIDYVKVTDIVKEEMNIPSKLIETVGHRIAERFKREVNNLYSIRIKIKKFNPPMEGEVGYVSITIDEDLI